jgi:hypothetical protein
MTVAGKLNVRVVMLAQPYTAIPYVCIVIIVVLVNSPPRHCPDCQSTELRAIGAGTVRIEETLQELFPKVPVHRIDRDSTRVKTVGIICMPILKLR